MNKRTKLKCFRCKNSFYNFKKREYSQIYRDLNNFPLCKDCFNEFAYDYLDGLYEFIMNNIEKYNYSFLKMQKDFLIVQCPNNHCKMEIYFLKSENIREYNCPECNYYFEFDFMGKIQAYAEKEDCYHFALWKKHDIIYDISDNPIIDYKKKKVILQIPSYCIECGYTPNVNEKLYFNMDNFEINPDFVQLSENSFEDVKLENLELNHMDNEIIDFGHNPDKRFENFEIKLKCWSSNYYDFFELIINCNLSMVLF